jgi:hypothetical protein
MRRDQLPDRPARLLPAGQRWGFGAHSVLPYLDMALHARPGEVTEASIRNPVFPQMESTLQQLRRH